MTKALDTPLVRIVDDDAEQLKSLAFLLRMGGWEVMTYQSAAAFLEMDDPRRSGCLLGWSSMRRSLSEAVCSL